MSFVGGEVTKMAHQIIKSAKRIIMEPVEQELSWNIWIGKCPICNERQESEYKYRVDIYCEFCRENEKNKIRNEEISLLKGGHIIFSGCDNEEEGIYIIIKKNCIYIKKFIF